jgi:hypothetical protein
MPKRKKSLTVRIPPYVNPRNSWRLQIYGIVGDKKRKLGIRYSKSDKLEDHVHLYFDKQEITFHDIDNRLKDITDALQGRVGGEKSIRKVKPIIPNDNQIYRVIAEKGLISPQSHGWGHLRIKKISMAK